MKYFGLILTIIIICIIILILNKKKQSAKVFQSAITERNGCIIIPFNVTWTTTTTQTIFRNSLFGVELAQVIVDEIKTIKEKDYGVFFDDIDIATQNVCAGGYVYLNISNLYDDNEQYWTLVTASNIKKDNLNFMVYEIPKCTKSINITYRIRYPNGKKSSFYQILLMENK